jgi:hypothetical protein
MSTMDYDDDDFGRVTKKAKRRESQSWHKEVREAMEEEQRETPVLKNAYAILNEATPIGAAFPITEILQPVYTNYQAALDGLADIADDAGVGLEDEASVSLPVKGTHLETDEYYIVELELSNG